MFFKTAPGGLVFSEVYPNRRFFVIKLSQKLILSMNSCLNTTPKHYIPLFPPSSLLQGMDNIVDLSPRCSIEAVTRQELLDDDRVNTVA